MANVVKGAGQPRPFAPWRIVVWLVMLLAAFGFVIHAFVGVRVAFAIGALSDEALAAGPPPWPVMLWSVGYALAAFAVMVLALGTLRWRTWARAPMRVAAAILAVWFIWTAVVEFQHWQQIGADLMRAGLPADYVAAQAKQRTILQIGIILKAVSVPLLAWLSWVLGTVKVRQQFARTGL
jgi:uncharacterized membrane protein YidH (DUF202 family)